MASACVLLFLMGVLGATDILVFHIRAHRLRERVESRAELVTHFLRGPTYAALFFVLPNYELQGSWFLALLGLLVVDAVISLADFWLEPQSRRSVGGLPRGEYILHVVLAGLFGALAFAVFQEGAGRLSSPASIHWVPWGSGDVPTLLRVTLIGMAPIVLWTGLLDLAAVVRLGRRPT